MRLRAGGQFQSCCRLLSRGQKKGWLPVTAIQGQSPGQKGEGITDEKGKGGSQ